MAQVAAVAGPALSAVGAIRQGNANANMADYNAQISNQNAAIVQQQGEEEARRSLVNTRKFLGAATASYGASGVTSDGSAMDVLRSSAAQGELNALTLKNNAAIKAAAYQNQAALDRYRGTNEQIAGYMNAASDLLSGGSKASGKFGGGGSGMSGAGDYEDMAAEIA